MKETYNSRRSFIRKAAMGGIIAAAIPEIVAAAISPAKSGKITLMKNSTILFQGDSITDAGRNKEENSYNNGRAMGSGYAMLAGASLLEKHPAHDLKI